MMKYRSRFKIASTILHGALEANATKTRLMYGSFLSFAQINEYLGFLLSNGLLMKREETHTFAITEKGMRFLRVYEELADLVPLEEEIPAIFEKERDSHALAHGESRPLLAHA
jgi:predicted transcriptional regulator